MNLRTIAAHTIDLDRLPYFGDMFDAGCRDFDFTHALLKERPLARVVAMDPAPDVKGPDLAHCAFLNMALVGDERGGSGFAHYSTGHGDFLTDAAQWHDAEMFRVPCINIKRLMAARGIKHWDLVKLDVEGSEFAILQNWPGPIATQISVEFHDWHGSHIQVADWALYYTDLFAKLAAYGYKVVQHELTDISGKGAWGHWDSLLVLNE